jgi:acyl-CoA thioester hydrolase
VCAVPTTFRHRLRVRYGECDPQGVVFFANYPAYLDVAMTELWRERIGPYDGLVQSGADMVVGELQVRYRGSATFDDELDVVIDVQALGETSMTCGWRVERDGDVLVDGMIRQVCVDTATKRKRSLPDDVRSALA